MRVKFGIWPCTQRCTLFNCQLLEMPQFSFPHYTCAAKFNDMLKGLFYHSVYLLLAFCVLYSVLHEEDGTNKTPLCYT